MSEIASFAASSDPKRQFAEKLAEKNGGTLGLTREQAEQVLKARGWAKPAESVIADAAASATDPALDHLRSVLARDDLTPEWRAMVEKMISDTAAVRARHQEMKAAVKKP